MEILKTRRDHREDRGVRIDCLRLSGADEIERKIPESPEIAVLGLWQFWDAAGVDAKLWEKSSGEKKTPRNVSQTVVFHKNAWKSWELNFERVIASITASKKFPSSTCNRMNFLTWEKRSRDS
jgi:hypothetical protein